MSLKLEYLTKKIRMNGGKTSPLMADAIDMLAVEVRAVRAHMESTLNHKIFWESVMACDAAAKELEATRKATGFVTLEDIKNELKRSDFETFLWCAATAVATAFGVLMAVHYG